MFQSSRVMMALSAMAAALAAGMGGAMPLVSSVFTADIKPDRSYRMRRANFHGTGKTYRPNGKRECARRRRQMGLE